jgi:hypothetical protein
MERIASLNLTPFSQPCKKKMQQPNQSKLQVLVDTSVIDLPQGRLCMGSLIFAISKTQGISRVVFSYSGEKISAQVQDLLNKIPRSITVETVKKEFMDFLTEETRKMSSSDFVFVYSSPLFLLPDSIMAAVAGIVQGGLAYTQLEENTSVEPGIISFAARYWKVPSYSNTSKQHTFMTRALTLHQDLEVFVKYDQPFEILDVLRGRKIATPMPSLATSLPMPSPNYPMINWQATISMIEQAMF